MPRVCSADQTHPTIPTMELTVELTIELDYRAGELELCPMLLFR